MAIKTATLRTEVERHRVGKGAGLVSHAVQGPRVLPALGNYADGTAAFLKGVVDLGNGIRDVGKAMRTINGKFERMNEDNAQIDKGNAKLDAAAEFMPAEADYFQSQKQSRRTFGSYW